MKKILSFLLVFFLAKTLYADHITGGTIFYTLTGVSGNNYTYDVTLLLYKNQGSGAELDDFAAISVFRNDNGQSVVNRTVPRLDTTHLRLKSPDPCITNPPAIYYIVGRYQFTVTLQGIPAGYTIAYQRCCRIIGINNLQAPSSDIGATYTAQIPGTNLPTAPAAPQNNSARFTGADTIVVCANNQFCYDFGAVDPDPTDSLVYSFCTAFTSQQNPPNPNPPANPPYIPVVYKTPFKAGAPLGDNVTLDPATGVLCGVAPAPGIYVVTVCVSEFRNGLLIATQRKDLQIKVGDCNMVNAVLPTSIPMCDDFTRVFSNQSPPSALVNSYTWDFGDPASGVNNISTLPTPTHTFSDTGVYVIKLVLNQGQACSDSATTIAYVYPGFFPDFNHQGICVDKPTQFNDVTTTAYGFVNSWNWDFGNTSTTTDVSTLQHPSYTYNTTGPKDVRLIVTSNKGCIDTIVKQINILDKPVLQAAPKDTLICNGAQVTISASGNGAFAWTGNNIVSGANTSSPTVAPPTSTQYVVQLTDNGCVSTDTVQVNVVDFVTLNAMADTTICATDSVQLMVNSNGLHYTWTPAGDLDDPTAKTPMALPLTTTTYTVVATIDHCVATDQITVTPVPYPIADAGPDITICFGSSAQLNASMVGNSFTWTPSGSLNNPNILNPVASPVGTTSYILMVTDILGCPKPVRDTMVVTVLPEIIPFAGNDTAVVVGQPLQFNASGGTGYSWTPATGLSNPNIPNPLAVYDGTFDSITYKLLVSNAAGCFDSAFVTVKIFKTHPQIFVPTAFTPNGDGRNDISRPIAVGMSKFEYFRVFNRWGQLVFETRRPGDGWDGRISGKEQGTGTFVWLVKGTDYTGKPFFAKGTVTLIR